MQPEKIRIVQPPPEVGDSFYDLALKSLIEKMPLAEAIEKARKDVASSPEHIAPMEAAITRIQSQASKK